MQTAGNVRETVLGYELVGDDDSSLDTYGVVFDCRYNKQGNIILTPYAKPAGHVHMFEKLTDDEGASDLYIYGDIRTSIYDKMKRSCADSSKFDVLSIDNTIYFAIKFSLVKHILLDMCDIPKYHALYTLGYMAEHFSDVNFWRSLAGYRYFTLEGDTPQRLE